LLKKQDFKEVYQLSDNAPEISTMISQ